MAEATETARGPRYWKITVNPEECPSGAWNLFQSTGLAMLGLPDETGATAYAVRNLKQVLEGDWLVAYTPQEGTYTVGGVGRVIRGYREETGPFDHPWTGPLRRSVVVEWQAGACGIEDLVKEGRFRRGKIPRIFDEILPAEFDCVRERVLGARPAAGSERDPGRTNAILQRAAVELGSLLAPLTPIGEPALWETSAPLAESALLAEHEKDDSASVGAEMPEPEELTTPWLDPSLDSGARLESASSFTALSLGQAGHSWPTVSAPETPEAALPAALPEPVTEDGQLALPLFPQEMLPIASDGERSEEELWDDLFGHLAPAAEISVSVDPTIWTASSRAEEQAAALHCSREAQLLTNFSTPNAGEGCLDFGLPTIGGADTGACGEPSAAPPRAGLTVQPFTVRVGTLGWSGTFRREVESGRPCSLLLRGPQFAFLNMAPPGSPLRGLPLFALFAIGAVAAPGKEALRSGATFIFRGRRPSGDFEIEVRPRSAAPAFAEPAEAGV